jgi:hypothetical protein
MPTLLQAIGVAYLAFMVYLTFLYYKRNNYSIQSFIFWMAIWLLAAVLLLIPNLANVIIPKLQVVRVLDLYLIVGLLFFSAVCFFSYAAVKRTESKVEELVRQVALKRRK